MTTQQLNADYDRKFRILQALRDDGDITLAQFDRMVEQLNAEHYFAIDVVNDLEFLFDTGRVAA